MHGRNENHQKTQEAKGITSLQAQNGLSNIDMQDKKEMDQTGEAHQ